MSSQRTPVLFIHGLWLHASSWAPWVALFRDAGYEASAPGWPSEADTVAQARAQPERVANQGIDDLVAHFIAIVDSLPTPPILIGHSFGGLIAEKLIGQGIGLAAVAIEKWTILSPASGLFEVAFANFSFHAASKVNTENNSRGPLLLIS